MSVFNKHLPDSETEKLHVEALRDLKDAIHCADLVFQFYLAFEEARYVSVT